MKTRIWIVIGGVILFVCCLGLLVYMLSSNKQTGGFFNSNSIDSSSLSIPDSIMFRPKTKQELISRPWRAVDITMNGYMIAPNKASRIRYIFTSDNKYIIHRPSHLSNRDSSYRGEWRFSYDAERLLLKKVQSLTNTYDLGFNIDSLSESSLILSNYEKKDTYGGEKGLRVINFVPIKISAPSIKVEKPKDLAN